MLLKYFTMPQTVSPGSFRLKEKEKNTYTRLTGDKSSTVKRKWKGNNGAWCVELFFAILDRFDLDLSRLTVVQQLKWSLANLSLSVTLVVLQYIRACVCISLRLHAYLCKCMDNHLCAFVYVDVCVHRRCVKMNLNCVCERVCVCVCV